MFKDLKYLSAYIIPLSVWMGMVQLGWLSFATVVVGFVFFPILEVILPTSDKNIPEEAEEARSNLLFFDVLLYLNVPIVFGTVFYYLHLMSSAPLALYEIFGLTSSVGIMIGVNAINVAHEMGHRETSWEQNLAKFLLMPALYMHFFIEHNFGHHKYVATERDPATARLGEPVFAFWFRALPKVWLNAWDIEKTRLTRAELPVFSLHNEMLRFVLAQVLYLLAIGFYFGWMAVPFAVVVALLGVLLLESINYVEHYGLRRKLLPSGRPEPVSPSHSWNSDHELGRIFFYELTRHSDHHFKATRKYQILRHLDESPQLPYGYPTSVLLAMVPPLWFRIMNKRAEATRA